MSNIHYIREDTLKAQVINRKQFLQGNIRGELAIRPPWAIEESHFIEECTRCFQCAEACPSHLIVKGAGGFPVMSFLRQGCDYCEACVKACPESALFQTKSSHTPPWYQLAVINEQCFANRGVVCRSCGEVCESRAIEFKIAVGGNSQVDINAATCDGCGECVHVCPAQAIKIQKVNLENQFSVNQVGENPCGENL